jgi:hypothetical protein
VRRGRGVHDGARVVRGRFGGEGSDRRDPRVSDSERAAGLTSGALRTERGEHAPGGGGVGADKSAPLGNERARGKRERAREGADRRGPPVKEGWRARLARDGPAGLN